MPGDACYAVFGIAPRKISQYITKTETGRKALPGVTLTDLAALLVYG